MKINIKATNLDLTPALKEYIERKIGDLERFLVKIEREGGGEISAFVEVGRSTRHHHKGKVFQAECDLKLPGKMIRAEDVSWDVRVAIDAVKDKLQQEIKKYKERI